MRRQIAKYTYDLYPKQYYILIAQLSMVFNG